MKIYADRWYRNRAGNIVYCVGRNMHDETYPFAIQESSGDIHCYTADGRFYDQRKYAGGLDIVEHLPDCTGFDWVPKPTLQLREGAWYRRKDGKIVGPCKPSISREDRFWTVGGYFYMHDGTNTHPNLTLEEEVSDPTPKPVYRPFVNSYEFAEYRDRWVRSSNTDNNLICRAMAYNDTFVFFNEDPITMEKAFEKLLFEDGTPFGVRVS